MINKKCIYNNNINIICIYTEVYLPIAISIRRSQGPGTAPVQEVHWIFSGRLLNRYRTSRSIVDRRSPSSPADIIICNIIYMHTILYRERVMRLYYYYRIIHAWCIRIVVVDAHWSILIFLHTTYYRFHFTSSMRQISTRHIIILLLYVQTRNRGCREYINYYTRRHELVF